MIMGKYIHKEKEGKKFEMPICTKYAAASESLKKVSVDCEKSKLRKSRDFSAGCA